MDTEKRRFLSIFITVSSIFPLLISFNFASAQTATANNNLLIYSNSDFGFKIQYLSNWKKINSQQISQLERVNLIVAFIPPKETNSEASGVLIYTEDLTGKNMTIKQYAREKYNELTQKQEDQNRIEKIDKDAITYVGIERTLSMPKDQRKGTVDVGGPLTYKVLADNPINISSIPAWKIRYSALDGLLNGRDIYILKDNNAYVISYFGYQDLYSKFSPVAQKMIESIQFTR